MLPLNPYTPLLADLFLITGSVDSLSSLLALAAQYTPTTAHVTDVAVARARL